MRIRTLAGPPLEHEIISDVLRAILLTDATVPAGNRREIDADPNASVVTGIRRPRLVSPST